MKNLSKIFFDKYFFLLLTILLIIFWKWWVLGPRVANDFPIISLSDLKAQFDIPRLWFLRGSVGFGGYSVYALWSWLIDLIAGFLANLGMGIVVLERIMLVIPIILIGSFSIWKLLGEFGLSRQSKLVASLFYLSNTYLLLLIDGGQLAIGLAFAWFPTVFTTFQNSLEGGLDKKIIAGFSFWLLGILDIRFVYVVSILFAIKFFFDSVYLHKTKWRGWINGWITSSFVVITIFVGLNAYWIVPLVTYPVSDSRFADLTKVSDLSFTQFKHSIALLQPHWFENIFGKISPFRKEFLLIPILAFLAPFLRARNKQVWFWVLVAAVSVFLAKGNNPPLSEIYPWLFSNIPGFSLFRDSTKFFFLVALSYAVLIAFTVDSITQKYPKIKMLFSIFLVGYFVLLSYPSYTGKMTGTFSLPRHENEYSLVGNIFENDKNFGRIFWISSRPPLGYASRLHSSLEASRLESLRPFAISTVGTYETQNFIREGNYMGELFDISGIKYIAYPYFDPKRDDMSEKKVEYYNTFLNQIENLPWIGKKISDIPVPVFETKENKDKFFLSQNTYLVIGSDRIYTEIKDLGAKFSGNALVFVEESNDLMNQAIQATEARFILYNKNLLDLTVSLVESGKFISPSTSLDFSPNQTGWWKREAVDLVWTRDFLQQKYGIDNLDFDYGNGWAISEGENELNVNSSLFTKGNILFARVMQSSQGGEVNFYQGEKLIGNTDTKIEKPEKVFIKLTGNENVPDRFYQYDKADFHWVRIGEILEDGSLTIKTRGEINIVNSLVVVAPNEEEFLNKITADLIEKGKVVEWDKLKTDGKKDILKGESKAKILYQVLAPTHYKVKVEGLEAPTTLFFSETFDSGWELDSVKGYKLYSLINGFWIDHDGEYDLYFTPQKYVIPGLVVSIITLTSCIMVLVWKKSKKSS